MVSIGTFKNLLDRSTVYLDLKQKSADKNKERKLKKKLIQISHGVRQFSFVNMFPTFSDF